ncbi:hypothetical protein DSECCO2_653260 [anaerobic digester metagenome]
MRACHIIDENLAVGHVLQRIGGKEGLGRLNDVSTAGQVLLAMAEQKACKFPGRFLHGGIAVCINHEEVTVIAGCHITNGILESRIRDYHPLAAFEERRIVLLDSTLLVETGVGHGDVVVVLVEEVAGILVGRRSKVAARGSPLLHVGKSFQPSFVTDNGFLAIGAEQVAAELFNHRNKEGQIVRIAEVKAAADEDVAVTDDQLLGDVGHLFPSLGVIRLRIETGGAEHLLVQVDGPVGQFQGKTVYLAIDGDGIQNAVHVLVQEILLVGIAGCLVIDRCHTTVGDVGILVLDGQVEHVRALIGGEGGLHQLDLLDRSLGGAHDGYVRVVRHELGDELGLELGSCRILMGPVLDGYGLGFVNCSFFCALCKYREREQKSDEQHNDERLFHVRPPNSLSPFSLEGFDNSTRKRFCGYACDFE